MATKEMKRRVGSYIGQGLVRQALDRVFDADEVDAMIELMAIGAAPSTKDAERLKKVFDKE